MTPPRWAGAARRTCSVLVALTLTTLTVAVATPAASAADLLTTTSTDVLVVAPSSTTPLTGASVSGLEADSAIQVTVSTDAGTLTVTDPSGLDLAFGNHWAGDASITFSGVRDELNVGLASLELTSGADTTVSAKVTVTALAAVDGFVYSPSNQHFYQYVPSGVDWDSARVEASNLSFLGQPGYLATIPSAEVNELVSSRIDGAANVWFGAHADDEYPYRYWKWADGPLAGKEITTCANWMFGCANISDPSIFNSWAPGEPNNYNGEWVAVTNWGGARGNWNDLASYAATSGYVVEYGDQTIGASTPFSGLATATSTVQVRGVPGAPTGVSAVRGDRSATVTFAAPANDGGTPITGYTVLSAPGDVVTECDASPCEVTGLTNGTGYTFQVIATNSLGPSALSEASEPVTPATVPGVPTDVTVEAGSTSATVSFTAPADNGGSEVTGYVVTVAETDNETVCLASPCVVTKLTNGDSYTLNLQAMNDVGRSASVPAGSADPIGTPSAPTEITADAGNGSATVTFTPPGDNGGASITRYHITTLPDGTVTECDASPCTVEGLTNGTAYTFTVAALNKAGLSSASDASNEVTPATVPGAPTEVRVERGNGSATLTFTAPSDNGGSAITGYEVSLDDGHTWTALTTTGDTELTATVDGLTNGTRYVVAVRALNKVGAGEAVGDLSVTPAHKPGTPTEVTAVRGDSEATVSFSTPDSNGSKITGYSIRVTQTGRAVDCTASPCVVTGLENGTGYTFTVIATNDVGSSTESEPSTEVTPAGVPAAPQLVKVASQDGGLVYGFKESTADNGSAVVGYEVRVDDRDWMPAATFDIAGGERIGFLPELTNGVTYQVAVRAVNGAGFSARSNAISGMPAGKPGKVSSITTSVHEGALTVSWKAPLSDGGAAITGYRVLAAPGGASCASAGTSCTFHGLTTGVRYTFTVAATNAQENLYGTGFGPATTSSKTLLTGRPSAPQALRVTPGDRKLALAFTAPADNGGTKVTGYQLSLNGGKTWKKAITTGTAPIRVTLAPVLNGTTFAVAVRAVNAVGAGKAAGPVRVATVAWFTDPLSKATWAKLVPVPKHPASYRGPVRATKATMRSADGKVAMSGASLRGRQLQPGQAANLDTLFAFDNATLTAKGKAEVKAFVGSLHYVKAITCEGYADFGGISSREKALSTRRAGVVCDLVKTYAPQVTSRTKKAYGSTRPVVIGGSTRDRAPNRRVVVLVRG